ncbi:MAG: gluconolactonase [Chthonomonadaceae bacterium]|nr:gluconolactonase [Chthonomonadaceae bacterium]
MTLSSSDSEAWKAILPEGAEPEKVAGGFQFTEGPLWDRRGFLLFSDIPASTLYQWTPGYGEPVVFRKPTNHTNGNTFDLEERLISCEHDGRLSRTEPDGSVVTLTDTFEGKRLNSPNDVVVKSDGGIYFTDPPYGLPKEKEELGFYGVYRLKDGDLTLLTKEQTRPNGLAFSPDETRLYVANSDPNENVVFVYDVKPDGTITNGRLFADLSSPGKAGLADGMKVDVHGNLFTTGPEGVWVFAPDGVLLGKILTPEVPANLTFGDADFKTLYITARTSVYRIRVQSAGLAPGNRV